MLPARIVPTLADEAVYIASESTFQRMLRALGQTRHRGPRQGTAQEPAADNAHRHRAAPRQLWCWDMTATTGLAMLWRLGVKPSYSRPRVSDDNAFVESLFRTAKYRPKFPASGFADLAVARE